jgi:hypothetical protein
VIWCKSLARNASILRLFTDRKCTSSSSPFPPYRHFFERNSPDTARLIPIRSSDVSVLSRFMAKFVEIIAAGLATAASGYLIAHLSGALSSPTSGPAQAVIEAAPNAIPPAQSASPISADLSEQHTATKQEAASAVPQPARPVNAAKAALPRKHTETATSAAETKRDQESLAARVRDALANVDASRTGPPAAPPRDVRLGPAGPAAQPQSSAELSRGAATGASPPTSSELRSVPAQPAQPNPLIAVEVQSRPVATVQPSPASPADTETGIVSTLEQVLRHDPLAGSVEAPRPPMPVGQ